MRCPACGAEVDRLINEVKATEKFGFTLTEDGEPSYEFIDGEPEDDGIYVCPMCGEVLARSEEEAIKLLKQ